MLVKCTCHLNAVNAVKNGLHYLRIVVLVAVSYELKHNIAIMLCSNFNWKMAYKCKFFSNF